MDKQEQAAFRPILNSLRERLVRELKMSENALREDLRHTGDLSNLPTHPADHDVEGVDEEIAIARNEEELLSEVVDAIERIKEGTFGTCDNCGKPIARERLQAIPYAPRCVTCARIEQRGRESFP